MRKRTGFTFIEILTAMAVFGLLTAIAVPKYRGYKERAYVASMKSDLGTLRVAEEAYWAENMAYSPDTTALDWRATSDIRIAISSSDFVAGFTATASHKSFPGTQCMTYVGRDATTTASGEIVCSQGSVAVGSGINTP